MTQWKVGQSGNPDKRGRPRRLSRANTVANLAKAIAREQIEFTDGQPNYLTGPETATYTRLERLLRVLWTMALEGDLAAIRCLLEYMEGKPARQVVETARKAGAPLTADDMAVQLPLTPEEDEAWQTMLANPPPQFGKSG